MMNENFYINLVALMKIFEGRPHHFAKFLLENEAFTEEFLAKLEEDDLHNDPKVENSKNIFFVDIDQMNEFFNSLLSSLRERKEKIPLEQELNQKLQRYLDEEKYEDAIRIRDYMIKNGIPFKKD